MQVTLILAIKLYLCILKLLYFTLRYQLRTTRLHDFLQA